MKYTVRYAHLESVFVKEAQALKEGDIIGRMGNTGQSTGAHLHIDCVEGRQTKEYTLQEIEAGKYKSNIKQLNHFIDDYLFGVPLRITTYYGEPDYQKQFGKVHHGYDVVPVSGDKIIKWNRSKVGFISAILQNHPGYGNCVYITFEA